MSNDLPARWSGGVLGGLEPPLEPTWFDERVWCHPDCVAALRSWEPLESLAEPDPREEWGTLGLGDGKAPWSHWQQAGTDGSGNGSVSEVAA